MHFLIRRHPPKEGALRYLVYEIWNLDAGEGPPERKHDIDEVRAFFVALSTPTGEIESAFFELAQRDTAEVKF
jgi:hypothetical protein